LLNPKQLLGRIIASFDSPIIRAYSKIRFTIININILDILALCLRQRRKVLDVGCGFGLFGCYFASLYPEMQYRGVDLDAGRIEAARCTASRLGLNNVCFERADARTLAIDEEYDAVMMIDLLHHIDDAAKHRLLELCAGHLRLHGRLIIKDVTTHPWPRIAFTWTLDALLTGGFDMWYWPEERFLAALGCHFRSVELFPISDWMPYPHVVYLCE